MGLDQAYWKHLLGGIGRIPSVCPFGFTVRRITIRSQVFFCTRPLPEKQVPSYCLLFAKGYYFALSNLAGWRTWHKKGRRITVCLFVFAAFHGNADFF